MDPPHDAEIPAARPARLREQLLARVVDSLGPSSASELQQRTGFGEAQVAAAADALVRRGKLRRGRFRQELDHDVYCTPLNLEQIRRRSLTHARRAVQPVPAVRLQRLVLELQREGTADEAVEGLALRPLPAEVLERDLLPLRLGSPGQPGRLDEAVASGELLWTGHGPRRVVLCPRELLPLAARLAPPDSPEDDEARALLAALNQRGASFLAELAAALPGLSVARLKERLWDLVWAGLLTNDRLASLRQGLIGSFEAPSAAAPAINPLTGRRSTFRARRAPRRPLSVGEGGPWAGRWALFPRPDGSPAEAEALVGLLLRRHGLICRELVQHEPLVRWGELYPVLCELELAGELARGLFVEGLGPAQFAPAPLVDRLRADLDEQDTSPLLLNSCDPALVAPALGLPLPGGQLSRRPANYVVLERGQPVVVAETAGGRLHLDPAAAPERQRSRVATLAQLLERGFRAVRVERINGQPALRSPLAALLRELGFRADGRVLEIRKYG